MKFLNEDALKNIQSLLLLTDEQMKVFDRTRQETFSPDEVLIVKREHNSTLFHHENRDDSITDETKAIQIIKDAFCPILVFYQGYHWCLDGNHRLNTAHYLQMFIDVLVVRFPDSWDLDLSYFDNNA